MFHSHFQRYLTIQIDSVLNMSEILDSFNKVGNNFDTNFYLISNMTAFLWQFEACILLLIITVILL